MNTRSLFFIFIPAILVAGLAFAVRVVQFEPLYPKQTAANTQQDTTPTIIPISPQDPIVGEKRAGITVVAFEDYGCAACKEQSTIFNELLKKYPKKVKLVWKGLPIQHPLNPTDNAHRYAYCANVQKKFPAFKDYAFANSDDLSPAILEQIAVAVELDSGALRECLDSDAPMTHIEEVEQLANTLRIQSVPTFYIDNQLVTSRPETVEGWEMLLGLK